MEKALTSGNANRERGLHSPCCQDLLSQLYFTVDSHKKKSWRGFLPLPSIFPGGKKEVRIAEFQIAKVL